MKRYLLPALVLCLSSAVLSQQDPPVKPKTIDLVHMGDVVDVDVIGGLEFDWRGRLTPEGDLDGFDAFDAPISALCRSEAEVAADVAKALGKILREPNVVVKIVDRSGRVPARLTGAVRNPMRFGLMRTATLRELIVVAGGLTDGASGEISILRQNALTCEGTSGKGRPDNGSRTINIKISELLSGKTGSDAQILSGDIITVERALPVYIIGAVNSPRPLYSRADITVSQAIAIAGGLAKHADGSKVTIFRREGTETTKIDADLGKIKRGESGDVILRPFDIIDVAARGGGTNKYPPVLAALEGKEQGKTEPPLRIID